MVLVVVVVVVMLWKELQSEQSERAWKIENKVIKVAVLKTIYAWTLHKLSV